MATQQIPAPVSPFLTPSGRYFASAADATFWTKVENERAAERERLQQRIALRLELKRHFDAMAIYAEQRPMSLTVWGEMVGRRVELEAACEALGMPSRRIAADGSYVWPSDELATRIVGAVRGSVQLDCLHCNETVPVCYTVHGGAVALDLDTRCLCGANYARLVMLLEPAQRERFWRNVAAFVRRAAGAPMGVRFTVTDAGRRALAEMEG